MSNLFSYFFLRLVLQASCVGRVVRVWSSEAFQFAMLVMLVEGE